MEYFDILDERGNETNIRKSMDEAHEKGLIHRAAHVWILNSQKQLLLQKRAPNKIAYGDCWDISAAGHVSAGETTLNAAQRETEEELGVDLDIAEFKKLATLEEHTILNNGTYINNEFQDIYLVNKDLNIQDMKLADEEVGAVKWIDREELKKWVSEKRIDLVPHDEEYQLLFKAIESL